MGVYTVLKLASAAYLLYLGAQAIRHRRGQTTGTQAMAVPTRTLQMLLLGTVVPVVALVSDSLWALAAGTARSWFAGSPRRVEVLGASGGLAMVGLGAGVALSGSTD